MKRTPVKSSWQFQQILIPALILSGMPLITSCETILPPTQNRGLYAEAYETRRTLTGMKTDQSELHQQMKTMLMEMDKKLSDQDKLIRKMNDDMQRQISDLQEKMKVSQAETDQVTTTSTLETEFPPSLTPSIEELQLFNAAQADIEAQKYDSAINRLNQFLAQYPASSNAARALYRLGRVHYEIGKLHENGSLRDDLAIAPPDQRSIEEAKRSFEESAKAFERIPTQYPASTSIIPTALYAQAAAELKLQRYAKARGIINRLTETYPDYEPAAIAKILKDISDGETKQEKPISQ